MTHSWRRCAAPDDDLPRLVFADWFDENGDPTGRSSSAYRSPSRTGRRGKKLAALQEREKGLLTEHKATWTEPLSGFTDNHRHEPFAFRRGFVESISIDDELLMEHGDELFRTAPIRTLVMADLDGFHDLHKCKHLLRITTLDLTGSGLDDRYRGSAKFFGSEYLANLTTLIARGYDDNGHLDAGGLEAVVRSKHLAKVRVLDIGHNWLFNVRTDAERTTVGPASDGGGDHPGPHGTVSR